MSDLSKRALIGLFSLATLVATSPVMAVIYGTDVTGGDLVDVREFDQGELIIQGDDKELETNPTIGWDISWDEDNNIWRYTYTFYGFPADMSHVTLDVSDEFASKDLGLIVNNEATITYTDNGQTTTKTQEVEFSGVDAELDKITGAMKIGGIPGNTAGGTVEMPGFMIDFYSTNAPMWGDVFLKTDPEFTNLYYTNMGGTEKYGYIAVPDSEGGPPRPPTEIPIPEPTTIALLSLGLAGLGFTRRRMKA
jgi:hypothetical protein